MYGLDIDCISIYGIVRCKGFLVRGFFSGGLFGAVAGKTVETVIVRRDHHRNHLALGA